MNLPELVVNRIAAGLQSRRTRRSALARAAVAGSALAVAPVRYLIRPGTAWAVIGPGHCPPGAKCNDGYTAFCCELEQGRNACPEHTFIAGWWKCTDYRGTGHCHEQGVRYYIDCNRLPGQLVAGGCHCARGDCGRRRVDCNHFRYGQCNAHIQGTTEVVCRLVICRHPATVPSLHCNATEMVDDRTCTHNAPCLGTLEPKR